MAIDNNEDRADRGITAIEAAATQTGVWKAEMADTAVRDVLSYLAHSCDRLGLDPEQMFADGIESYRGDFEDGPQAQRIADGETASLHEIFA